VLDQDQHVLASNNTIKYQTLARTAQPINSQVPTQDLMQGAQITPLLVMPMDKFNLDNNNASHAKLVRQDIN
jgi:hypothetical protein